MKRGFTRHHFLEKKFSQTKTTKSGAGFTLVEMMVAVAIFVTVVSMVSTLFVQAIRAQRQNLAYQELLDQTSYAMEYMTRSIRMAMKDDIEIWGYPETHCLSGTNINYETEGQCLKFRNYRNECQFFCLNGTTLTTATTTDTVLPPPPAAFSNLTSPNLEVLSFNVTDPYAPFDSSWQQPGVPGDNNQPLVEIFLEIEGRENTSIRIQTSISQRNLDVQK